MSRILNDAKCKAIIHSHLDWLLGNSGIKSIGLHQHWDKSEDFAKGYRQAIQDARKVIEEAPYPEEFNEARLRLRIEELEAELKKKGA